MKLSFFITAAFMTLSVSNPVFAAPPADNTAKDTSSIETAIKNLELPSQGEIDEMLENLPDLNVLMGDMMDIMKDEKLRTQLKSSARTFKDKIEDSEVLTQRDANGLPDLNALMSVMLGTMTEDGMAGELLEGVAELAGDMEALAEKHAPESATYKPKSKP